MTTTLTPYFTQNPIKTSLAPRLRGMALPSEDCCNSPCLQRAHDYCGNHSKVQSSNEPGNMMHACAQDSRDKGTKSLPAASFSSPDTSAVN
eukprot:880850-Amphidinium_carterae.1